MRPATSPAVACNSGLLMPAASPWERSPRAKGACGSGGQAPPAQHVANGPLLDVPRGDNRRAGGTAHAGTAGDARRPRHYAPRGLLGDAQAAADCSEGLPLSAERGGLLALRMVAYVAQVGFRLSAIPFASERSRQARCASPHNGHF
jgi:hypothetical protein